MLVLQQLVTTTFTNIGYENRSTRSAPWLTVSQL